MKRKYNYFYKITNKINNHFYYGIHSTDNLNDGYMGSGSRLHIAYAKYGIENFEKEILKFFDDVKDAQNYEEEMVTEELTKNDNCYNILIGGGGFKSDGLVCVYDKEENINTLIHSDEFYKHKNKRYFAISYDTIPVKINGKHKRISREEYYKNKELYETISNGKITVKDKKGNFYNVRKDDKRLKSGELVPMWSGRKHRPESIEKMKETHKKNNHQQGKKNSSYGTCWITKNKENKKIKKELLSNYISNGWSKGRYTNDKKYNEKDIIKIKEMRKSGKKWKDIMINLNIPKTSFNNLRKKYNII